MIERDFIETTDVKFANLSEEAIYSYSQKEELWKGRAGGYAIQAEGMSLISEVKG
jgi:predicted house-cleaning NTP pyrophosphatase (Maf/HAM1 superfamily)